MHSQVGDGWPTPAVWHSFLRPGRCTPARQHSANKLSQCCAAAGWGLPYCFSAAAGFPKKKLAAIDAACMIHPAREPTGEGPCGCRQLLLPPARLPGCMCGWLFAFQRLTDPCVWLDLDLDLCVCAGGKPMGVSGRIRKGLFKPGSIYARFAELTPFAHPRQEQVTQWKVGGWSSLCAAAVDRQRWNPRPCLARGRSLLPVPSPSSHLLPSPCRCHRPPAGMQLHCSGSTGGWRGI